ncbi:hypothetical protein FGLOB1_10894 [Fusarium globosum]|uniref:Uncharacterized protein n=1 Tax=Fusarium globosum TaxID=78864 RepID=A0A8H6D0V0_9HYPO|nr:hypothetical protein FGLOB1_10894 [Fusarium globosum]
MDQKNSDKPTPAKKPDQNSSVPGLLPKNVEECLGKFLAVVDAENSTDEDKKRAQDAFVCSVEAWGDDLCLERRADAAMDHMLKMLEGMTKKRHE